jgi:hypothetical protein
MGLGIVYVVRGEGVLDENATVAFSFFLPISQASLLRGGMLT